MPLILSGDTGVPASGMPTGSVIQTVNTSMEVNTQTASTTYIDTGVFASITPLFSTSKILVTFNMTGIYKNTSDIYGRMRLVRGSTVLLQNEGAFGYTGDSAENNVGATSISYLDSPGTTSSTTYKTQILCSAGTGNVGIGRNGAVHTVTLQEIKQ
jgi:hypothetical protein